MIDTADRYRSRRRRRWSVAVLAATAATMPLSSQAIDEAEQRARLAFESQRIEEAIARQGLLYGDAGLDAYLQAVTDRMFPDAAAGTLRIRAIRDEEMNAFALPSGAIYVNTGALLRMRNEAELASLLGHEVSHVTQEHSLESVQSGKTLAGAATILTAGLGGGVAPLLGQLAAYSTLAGFSRAHEREADDLGWRRLAEAGYDPDAMRTFFDRVNRELKARKVKSGVYAFATHPRFESRVEATTDAAPATTTGVLGRDEYLGATTRVRAEVLDELRDRRQGAALAFLLGDEGMVDEFAPQGRFMLGEGYRLRGDEGDVERAAEQYRLSIEHAPDYAPPWGALGRHYAKVGDASQALSCLERYLELAPDARDAPFTRQAVERLRHGQPAPPQGTTP